MGADWFAGAADRDEAMRAVHADYGLSLRAGSARFDPRAVVNRLTAVDPVAVPTDDLMNAIDAWDRVISWATAGRSRSIAEAHARTATGVDADVPEALDATTLTAAEIGPLLGLTSGQSRRLVEEAVRLSTPAFDRTMTALDHGALDPWRTRVIHDELVDQPADVVTVVHDDHYADAPHIHVADAAAHTSNYAAATDPADPADPASTVLPPITRLPNSTTLRRRIRAIIARLTPDATEQERGRQVQRRRVRMTPAPAGMAWLEAYLPAEDATAVMTCLDQIAEQLRRRDRERPGNEDAPDAYRRTADQRRADALVMLAWSALHTGRLDAAGCAPCGYAAADHDATPTCAGAPADHDAPPTGAGAPAAFPYDRFDPGSAMRLGTAQGRPVTVNVTMRLGTALGLDDDPCELAGYGTITAPAARALLAYSTIRRLITDPVLGVIEVGSARYKPTRELADLITARDRMCRFPGCSRPAHYCDIDHVVAHRRSGRTDADNLAALCRTHHRVKHHAGWHLARSSRGGFVWTTPTGRTYAVPP